MHAIIQDPLWRYLNQPGLAPSGEHVPSASLLRFYFFSPLLLELGPLPSTHFFIPLLNLGFPPGMPSSFRTYVLPWLSFPPPKAFSLAMSAQGGFWPLYFANTTSVIWGKDGLTSKSV